ncbi:hypothetical protein [Aeribacillus pallidus]
MSKKGKSYRAERQVRKWNRQYRKIGMLHE